MRSHPLRICFLIRSLGVGGSEGQLVQLARGLDPEHFECHIITLYSSPYDQELRDGSRLTLHSLDKGHRWDLAPLLELRRKLRAIAPDILQGTLSVSNILVALSRLMGQCKARIVWAVRNSDMPNDLYGRMEGLVWRMESLLAHVPDAIVANSWRGAEWLTGKRGFPAFKVGVIPNGIDSGRFAFDVQLRNEVRERWGIAPCDYALGIVGRVDPVKGHRDFFSLAQILLPSIPQLRLVVVGEQREPLASELKLELRRTGMTSKVLWVPHTSELAGVYSALDLQCLCSASEGFPNVVAEARAAGLRIAGYDVGDAQRIAAGGGIFVPKGAVGELGSAVEELFRAFGFSRDGTGMQDITSRFGIQQMLQRYTALYQGLAAGVPFARIAIS